MQRQRARATFERGCCAAEADQHDEHGRDRERPHGAACAMRRPTRSGIASGHDPASCAAAPTTAVSTAPSGASRSCECSGQHGLSPCSAIAWRASYARREQAGGLDELERARRSTAAMRERNGFGNRPIQNTRTKSGTKTHFSRVRSLQLSFPGCDRAEDHALEHPQHVARRQDHARGGEQRPRRSARGTRRAGPGTRRRSRSSRAAPIDDSMMTRKMTANTGMHLPQAAELARSGACGGARRSRRRGGRARPSRCRG